MFKFALTSVVALACLSLAGEASARGGGGHGGGGFGGGFGGGSRGGDFDRGFDNRSNFGDARQFGNDDGQRDFGQRAGDDRPSAEEMQHFLGLPAEGGAARGFDNRGVDNRGLGANRTAAGVDRGGLARNVAGTQPGRIDNNKQWNTDRNDRRQQIDHQLANHGDQFRNWYNHNWWQNHPNDHWAFNQPWANWWSQPAWGALAAWGAVNAAEGVPYDYGNNVYYSGDSVYYGDQPVASAVDYANQAAQIAANVPQVNPQDVQWLPLGVFAVAKDGQASGADPTLFVQLAVSKEGIIAGTFQSTANDTVKSLEGSVDKKTQRAAWGVIGQKWPVVEAGIYNLTKDTAPVLVHFANGQTQQWLLVRVDKPADAAKPANSVSAN